MLIGFLIFFSPTNIPAHFWQSNNESSHHTFNTSLLYLAKCLWSKMVMFQSWL